MNEAAFAELTERYRRQLHVHCYRMLGSFDDAEDLVQETFLRAWRGRGSFEGRSLVRTWLYRIATNACINVLERSPRRVLPQDVTPPVTTQSDWSNPPSEPPDAPEITWLQPYPDHLLGPSGSSEPAAPRESEPDAAVVSRETIELAYVAALQHLPPRQRAVLILRDVLDWSAKETAALLETTVPSVNSALQRAHATMRAQLPAGSRDVANVTAPSDEERSLTQRFMSAWERGDVDGLLSVLRGDARWAMPPAPLWFDGRAAIAKLFEAFPIGWNGEMRMRPTTANRQAAFAAYLRRPGDTEYRLVSITLCRAEGGQLAELTTFSPPLIAAFDFPPTLVI